MDLDGFIAEARSFLPPSAVVGGAALEEYRVATSGHRREIPLAVKPQSRDDVPRLVALARQCRVPLYPISRGRNWGLGSRLPARDGSVVLDLSALDRIVSVDERFGVVTLEPGVTQRQLAEHLAAASSGFFLDVTGSGAETSVIGNTMERGVAYNTLRAELVQSLAVVLGTGETIRTGFGHFPQSSLAGLSRFGVGPDLSGLFLQSNLGIVVEATIRLVPRPKRQATFLASIADEAKVPELFAALQGLVREGSLHSIVHVANRRRGDITLTPLVYQQLLIENPGATRADAQRLAASQSKGAWSALGSITGTGGHVRQGLARVRRALRPFGSIRVVTPELRAIAKYVTALPGMGKLRTFLLAAEPLMNLNHGMPTSAALHSTYWPICDTSAHPDQPDLGPGGILFCAPVVPIDPPTIRAAIETTRRIGEEHGFDPAVTLNIMNDKTLEGVVSIDFPRLDDERRKAAHACLRAMIQGYIGLGCTPYRVDIDNMDLVVSSEDPFWRTIRLLKSVLDPDNVIAPGRYCLD